MRQDFIVVTSDPRRFDAQRFKPTIEQTTGAGSLFTIDDFYVGARQGLSFTDVFWIALSDDQSFLPVGESHDDAIYAAEDALEIGKIPCTRSFVGQMNACDVHLAALQSAQGVTAPHKIGHEIFIVLSA